jgi:hypothetical protein
MTRQTSKKSPAQLDRDIVASLAKAKKPRSSPPAWIVPREPGEASVLDNPKLRAWFGNSHVVDMWGEPLAVYHGTGSATFSSFDPARASSHSNPEYPIRGIYFGDEETARTWARGHRNGRVIKAYLRIERPLYVYGRPNCVDEEEALEKGHDGIIQQGGGEWVVFKPAQIKIIDKDVK